MSSILAPVSYAIAALLFLILAILVAIGWRRRLQSGLLLLAALVGVVWAGQITVQSVTGMFSSHWLFVSEVARDASWLVFLVAVLNKTGEEILSPTLRYGSYFAPLAVLLFGFVPIGSFGTPESVFV